MEISVKIPSTKNVKSHIQSDRPCFPYGIDGKLLSITVNLT